jgi:hypothetical protein
VHPIRPETSPKEVRHAAIARFTVPLRCRSAGVR